MESRVNYTVVGLFVVVLGAAFIVLFFWLSAFRHEKVYDTYVVFVKEDVTGLTVQSPVRFNGVPVGFVKTINLDQDNPQLVKLTLRVQRGTPISTSTYATLQFQGITGVLYVGLKTSTAQAPLLKVKPGEQYPIIPWRPSLILQLSQVLPEITKNVQSIGNRVEKLLSDKNQQAIAESLQNLSTFSKALADSSEYLTESMNSLSKTLKNASYASKDLPEAVQQLNQTLQAARKATQHIAKAAGAFQGMAAKGGTAIGNFNSQVMPSFQQSIVNLNQVMGNLRNLTQQLQRNPSAVVRGKTPEQPGPGER